MVDTPHSLLLRLLQPELPERDKDWQTFFELYTPYLRRWAQRQGFQAEDADDITQNVLLAVMQHLPRFDRTRTKFHKWLSEITRNKCIDFLRRRKNLPKGDNDGVLTAPDAHRPLEDLVEAEHAQWLLSRAEELIRPNCEDATWAVYWGTCREQRSSEEVAAALGLSVDKVYSAKNRVLRRLRDILEGLLDLS